MFSDLISRTKAPKGQLAIVSNTEATSWGELQETIESFAAKHGGLAKRRIGLSLWANAKSYAALAALDRFECDIILLNAYLPETEALRIAKGLRLGAYLRYADRAESTLCLDELPGEAPWSGKSSVTVLTSGTGGLPKAVRHTWESLLRGVRNKPGVVAPRWMLTYRPDLYAGLQVSLQCFADAGTLAVADPDPATTLALMKTAGVQFVSATPSFWKRFLLAAEQPLHQLPIQQITLGGEVVEQSLLDALRKRFPSARITHIYATTELGRCFVVRDGLSGFPARWLYGMKVEGVELKEHDGELWVKSPNAMQGYDDGSGNRRLPEDWVATGDLIEIKEDRAHFRGRKSDIINVGGSKVHPLEVEHVIRQVPGVADVRVFGMVSSLVGELVACQIVAAHRQDARILKKEVHNFCEGHLALAQRPRLIDFVETIEAAPSGKTLRVKKAVS